MKLHLLLAAALAAAATTALANEASPLEAFFSKIEPDALIEVIGSSAEADGIRENDILLDKVEISLEGELDDNVSFNVVGLYEDGEDITVDSAEIAYSLPVTEESSLRFSGGLIYMPFGSYESFFITDPLTLELGEISDGAFGVAYETKYATLSGFVFDGNLDDVDEDDCEELHYVAALDLTPADWLTFRASFISGFLHAGFADAINEAIAEEINYDDAAGINFAIMATLADFTLLGEYVGAIDDITIADTAARPDTWTVELGYNINDDFLVAARYEESSKIVGMPKKSYGIVASHAIGDYLSVSLEYLRDEYDGDIDGNKFTACFALEY